MPRPAVQFRYEAENSSGFPSGSLKESGIIFALRHPISSLDIQRKVCTVPVGQKQCDDQQGNSPPTKRIGLVC